jgi:mxaJ protein
MRVIAELLAALLVMPAKAGIHAESAAGNGVSMGPSLRWGDGKRRSVKALAALLAALFVMPAKAGIHAESPVSRGVSMGPSLRWGDEEGGTPAPRELKVCADPNNLPFSNAKGEGFENRIVALIAKDLGAKLTYTWWAQRRGNVRNTLNAGACDLIPGVGSSVDMLGTTRPYYRSIYAAVTRADRHLDIASFDDPRLRTLRIGVQLIGDDGANTPPAHALAKRGIVANVRGFMIYGDYDDPAPQAPILKAVADGQIDVAFVWGPVAGYFAAKQTPALKVTPLAVRFDGPQLPLTYDVSMGVRRDDRALREEVEAALARHAGEVKAILARYRVPTLDP